ncbi:2834_t:CDS:2 [Rhizophagus irregularis]|nr:2834_t:CDS:2 [Rhizophagus irregularis]
MSSWNREDENSNEETQELCGSDNPISDHKLPNELSEELKGFGRH